MPIEHNIVITNSCTDNFDTAINKKANNLNEGMKESITISSVGCRICLWKFESELELDIHNYLEHMMINHAEHKRFLEDICIVQE